MTLTDCTVSNNNATSAAGLFNAGTATLIGSTFANNSANNQGGALFNYGNIMATDDTFYGNSAAEGGVLYDSGRTTLANSTLVSNSAIGGGVGGAVFNLFGIEQFTNNTIAGNFAGGTGGIFSNSLFGTTELDDSIVVGNAEINRPAGVAPDPDVSGHIGGSNNVIGDPADAGVLANGSNGNIVGDGTGHPLALGAVLLTTSSGGVVVPLLANHGGPTLTVALAPGSPAIDHGSNAIASAAGLTTDQRGFSRVVNGVVDAGAFEDQVTVTPPATQTSLPGTSTSLALGAFIDARSAGGPWTVTVDWGDGTAFSQFLASAPGSLGRLSHTYGAPGDYMATVFVQDANGDASRGSFQVVTADGPTVTLVQRVGRGPSSVLLLSFNQPLNPAAAQDVANDVLVLLGRRRPIRIRAAVYNAATQTVALRAAAPLAPRASYVLTVHGAPPLGVEDAQGVFLDGSGSGRPGTDFTITVTPPKPASSIRSVDGQAH